MICLVQQNENYVVKFFVRVVPGVSPKQKVGIFIKRILLELRL